MRIAVVGLGITGLTAAYRLSQKGHRVVIFEKEKYLGGLAGGFKKENWSWHLENFFHHLFASDQAAKKLIAELGLKEKLFFHQPKTSIYFKNKISQFDSPFSLLNFPFLPFPQKVRTGLVTAYLKLIPSWQKFENVTATDWLKKYYGPSVFKILWQPLLQGKFGEQAEMISMAWFWARIKKRSSRLGYLKGGFQILIDKLVKKIEENHGQIFLNREIKDLKELKNFERIIITTPADKLFPTKLPKMLGAINLILFLKEQFLTGGTYWLNINEPNFPFVAVVEHTNFVDPKFYDGNHIVYVGGYYPQNHPYFKKASKQIFEEFLPYLKKINPRFNFQFSIFNFQLSASAHAQPLIPTNYSQIIPKFQSPIPNVYLANMQMVYPWDRGINYAIEMGEKVADEISKIS